MYKRAKVRVEITGDHGGHAFEAITGTPDMSRLGAYLGEAIQHQWDGIAGDVAAGKNEAIAKLEKELATSKARAEGLAAAAALDARPKESATTTPPPKKTPKKQPSKRTR
jgi:hypothetical protein